MIPTAEKNKQIVQEFIDSINNQNLSAIDDLFADGFSVEISLKGTEESAIGLEGVKAMYEEYYVGFPDFQHEIVEIVAESDQVAIFLLTRGTHEGEFRGVQPTGNRVEIDDAGWIRLADGEIVNMWPQSDMLGLFEQLGIHLGL